MKIASLLVGAAALALTAGAASAQDINQGQTQRSDGARTYSFANDVNSGEADRGRNIRRAAGDTGVTGGYASSWHALGGAVDNNGTAANSDNASFTMTGTVSTDCAYYSGNDATETFNFGQIGIYADDNTGPANAFTMVDAASLTIDTNLAGCNTANRVTINKTDLNGLVSDNGGGFDSDVFQNNLPYSVTATYTAPPAGAPAAGDSQTLVLDTGSNQISRPHGAWKSAMRLAVNIPRADMALVAGTYTGTFGVTISAGL